MATDPNVRTHSPEIQRAQAEERRQRLEEEKHQLEGAKYQLEIINSAREDRKHELEIKKHDLEKNKVGIDILKHLTTVIAALLAILGYFGSQLIPNLQNQHTLGDEFSDWELVITLLTLSLALSIGMLGASAYDPDRPAKLMEVFIVIILVLLMAAVIILLSGFMI